MPANIQNLTKAIEKDLPEKRLSEMVEKAINRIRAELTEKGESSFNDSNGRVYRIKNKK